MKQKRTTKYLWTTLALLSAAGVSTQAGEVFYDFNTEPAPGTFTTFGSTGYPEWRVSGGKDDSGYYAITDAMGSLNGTLILPDIDAGRVIKAFEFSVDVRIGDGTANPADGFSINYARANDPVLSTGNGYVAGAMEEGTTTGLAVSFDTYDNGGGDVVGISVRVDGNIVHSKAYPTRNGQIGDLTSLQTGPVGDNTGSSLAWEPFTVKLTEAGALTITYKGGSVVENLQTSFFPSPGRMVFAARTGNENELHHIDNLRLKTTPATSPTVGVIQGFGSGFVLPIDDAGTVRPNVSTIQATVNGQSATVTTSRNGSQTVVSHLTSGAFYAPGSTVNVSLTFQDTAGGTSTVQRTFVTPNYARISASDRTTNFDANSSGFNVRTTQIAGDRYPGDANSVASGETQLAGGIIDPATGEPYPNIADLSGADPTTGLFTVQTVNWDQGGADIDANPDATQPDNFNSKEPAANPKPNEAIPGIPTGDPNNIATEITACLELKRGTHIFGVNSDDGFLVTLGHSPLGEVLGFHSGGRGASDTLFQVAVEQDGVYPVRLSWWEGGGGANVEFFSVDAATGVRTLVNDRSEAGAIKAYSVCRGPAYVHSILPAEGAIGVGTRPQIKVVLHDDFTAVDDASVRIVLDGQQLTTSTSNSGTETTVTATPAVALEYLSSHTGQVIYTAGGVTYTKEFSFSVQSGGFAIEAEDFDYDGGQFIETANTNPYLGGAYTGLGAIHNVDYRQSYNEVNGEAYRSGEDPNVPMGGNNDLADRERPGYVVDNGQNWAIGWAGGGEWYNYTRTFTNGNYKIIAAQSHGDAAGTADRLVARFGAVIGGEGTDQQQTVVFGGYSEPSSGGWGNNVLSTAMTDGEETVIRLSGTETLRVWVDSGDFDWFAVVPTSERTALPFVQTTTPALPQRTVDSLEFTLSHLFRDTTVRNTGIALTVDGQNVSSALTVTPNANGATVRYAPAGGFAPGVHDYTLTFQNNEGTTITEEGTLAVIGQENFVIEAEDFNYASGQTKTEASVMPLQSGLFADLVPVHDVDYHMANDEPSGNEYRTTETPNVPMSVANGDLNRGSFDLEANWRIGWVDNGEWFNYTRTIPQGNYNVYAALSRDAGSMGGRLSLVQNATTANQTVTELGTFSAPASGAWGLSNMIPLRDTEGDIATVALGGTQTIRFTSDLGNGDIDYLLFVEADGGSTRPKLTITKNGNNVTITWAGGGTLEASPVLGVGENWTTAGTGGSVTLPISGTQRYFRVRL